MKKIVTIENSVTGREFGQTFYDQDEMDFWIAEQKAKALEGRGWGKDHSEPVIEDLTIEHEAELAEKEARKILLKDKNASTKDRLEALLTHLKLDI